MPKIILTFFSMRKRITAGLDLKQDLKLKTIIPLILPRAGEHRGAFSTTEIIIKADTKSPLQSCCCKV
jgi:hypothetical protein